MLSCQLRPLVERGLIVLRVRMDSSYPRVLPSTSKSKMWRGFPQHGLAGCQGYSLGQAKYPSRGCDVLLLWPWHSFSRLDETLM